MKKIILTSFMISCISLIAQVKPNDPDVILQKNDKTSEVLLVGSFHFAYYGLDAHVTKDENKVNIKSKQKQKEVKELVEYIARFKPTKIGVEGGRNSGYILRRYEDYLKNPANNKSNEIDQIAFPLMKQYGIDTIYGVNAWGMVRGLSNHKDSIVVRPILDSIYKDWDFRNEEVISERYNEFYDYTDELSIQLNLLDYFKYENSDKVINRGFGAYLVGDFKNGTFEGADALAMHWYNRNLRIFRNIQNISEPEDRILVIFGAGHMTILKNLFECSPEYELVKFNDL